MDTADPFEVLALIFAGHFGLSVQRIAISTSCHSNLQCPRTYVEVDVEIEMPTGFAELQVLVYLLENRISDLATSRPTYTAQGSRTRAASGVKLSG